MPANTTMLITAMRMFQKLAPGGQVTGTPFFLPIAITLSATIVTKAITGMARVVQAQVLARSYQTLVPFSMYDS